MGRVGALARTLAGCVLTAMLGSCVGLRSDPDRPNLDPKLSQSSFIEEGTLIALVVGTRAAHVRRDRDYLPLEVAVVNKGLGALSIGIESFTLRDSEGRIYPAVGREELARNYGNQEIDARFAEAGPIVANRFSSYTRIPSALTPGFDRPVQLRTFLPTFSYLLDSLYFPMPTEGVRDRVLELRLDAPELEHLVFVRFEVS